MEPFSYLKQPATPVPSSSTPPLVKKEGREPVYETMLSLLSEVLPETEVNVNGELVNNFTELPEDKLHNLFLQRLANGWGNTDSLGVVIRLFCAYDFLKEYSLTIPAENKKETAMKILQMIGRVLSDVGFNPLAGFEERGILINQVITLADKEKRSISAKDLLEIYTERIKISVDKWLPVGIRGELSLKTGSELRIIERILFDQMNNLEKPFFYRFSNSFFETLSEITGSTGMAHRQKLVLYLKNSGKIIDPSRLLFPFYIIGKIVLADNTYRIMDLGQLYIPDFFLHPNEELNSLTEVKVSSVFLNEQGVERAASDIDSLIGIDEKYELQVVGHTHPDFFRGKRGKAIYSPGDIDGIIIDYRLPLLKDTSRQEFRLNVRKLHNLCLMTLNVAPSETGEVPFSLAGNEISGIRVMYYSCNPQKKSIQNLGTEIIRCPIPLNLEQLKTKYQSIKAPTNVLI